MLAADVIAQRLYAAGCRHAFGIPGGEVLTLMNALKQAGLDFILTKHENNAGFMAEGTHHITGAPGVLLATIGPGVANAVNFVANAYQDQVPLIYLTGCIDADEAVTFTHQVFDHSALMKPITKASFTATAGAIDAIIDKAVAVAMDDRPGPVHIDIPISVANAEFDGNPRPARTKPSPAAPAEGPNLDAARKALGEAERPLMIAGIDVLHHGAADSVATFAHQFRVPLITTYKAKGVLSEDDPLALGGAGLSPRADTILQPLLGESDLIILAGYDPIEMRASWVEPWSADANVIEISALPNTHYVHQARLSFIGDIGAGLEVLADGVEPRETWTGGQASAARAAHKEAYGANGEWGPEAIVETARRALPRDGIATADTGAHRILLSQGWECYGPRTLLQSSALCTMGVALPLAMGVKLADPARVVIAFTGDAGLEMVLGELATLRDLKMPVAVVVFVDESLALIELKQRNSGFDNLGVDFGATDFPAVANAMGGHGVTAADTDTLAAELEAAFGRNTFSLIACPIGAKAYDGKL